MAIDQQKMAAVMQRMQLAQGGDASPAGPPGGGMMGAPGGAGMPGNSTQSPPPPDAPPGTSDTAVATRISGVVTIAAQSGEHAGKPPSQIFIEGDVMMRPIVTMVPDPNAQGAPPGMAPQGMPLGGMPPR
jgi:hypothetical protein